MLGKDSSRRERPQEGSFSKFGQAKVPRRPPKIRKDPTFDAGLGEFRKDASDYGPYARKQSHFPGCGLQPTGGIRDYDKRGERNSGYSVLIQAEFPGQD